MKKTNLDHFMDKIEKFDLPVKIPARSILSHHWLAAAHKDIKSGCEFKDGKCIKERLERDGKNCCHECAGQIGFLKQINFREIRLYAARWDKDLGFLGKRGCRLPLRMRSGACLGYRCGHAKNNMSLPRINKAVLEALFHGPI